MVDSSCLLDDSQVLNALDSDLDEVISRYSSKQPTQNFFQTTNEIAIARYALDQQAQSYYTTIKALKLLLSSQIQDLTEQSLGRIMNLLSMIELKSTSLISSAEKVSHLIGDAVQIDYDKASLQAVLLSLPSLIRELGSTEELAASVESRIDEMLSSLRFSEKSTHSLQRSEPIGITLEQYTSLLDSVPVQP